MFFGNLQVFQEVDVEVRDFATTNQISMGRGYLYFALGRGKPRHLNGSIQVGRVDPERITVKERDRGESVSE